MTLPAIILVFLLLIAIQAQNLRLDTPGNIFQAISSFGLQSNNLNNQNYQPLVPASAKPILPPVAPPAPEVFNDVRFTHHIPSTFVLGQVFSFSGEVNSTKLRTYLRSQPATKKTYYLSFVLIDEKTGNQISFTKQMFIKETKFTHQCLFNQAGSFYFGVFIGEKANITPRVYKVIDLNQEPQRPISNSMVPPKPQNLTLYVNENDLYISWKNQTPLTRVIISQSFPTLNRKEFIVSNDEGYFKVPFAEFSNFTKSITKIQISHAVSADIGAFQRSSKFSDPAWTEINVTEHLFQEIRYDEVELDQKIQSMVHVNSEVEIGGRSSQKIHKKAIIVDPRNQIREAPLDLRINSIENKFMLKQKIFDEGAYIIQINHEEGYALVNTPVYAGNSYPFLPDYSDLHPLQDKSPSSNLTIPQMRNLMLKLVNEKRKQFGVQPVVLDPELNQLAQSHSNDMGLRNFVGHQNLNGQNSGDRAKKRGIYSLVGENIAVNQDIQYAQFRLDRSPVHLKNTINPIWTRMGIGIYKKYNGVYYITQEFSCEDLTKIPLTYSKILEISEEITNKLSQNSPKKMTLNKKFSQSLQQWYSKNGYSSEKVGQIRKIMTENNVRGGAKVMYFTTPYVAGYLQLVEEEGYFDYLGFDSVAIGIRVGKGNLEALMIFY